MPLRYSFVDCSRRWRFAVRQKSIIFVIAALVLYDHQIFRQAIEAPTPEALIAFEPFVDISERSGLKVAGAPLGLSAREIKPAVSSTLRCFGNGCKAHVIRFGQLSHCASPVDRRAKIPRRVGSERANRVELRRSGSMYSTNRLLTDWLRA